jgi:hypothetical protein
MGLPELIPQAVLFGNPDKAEPKLSPDGAKYAYLANSDKGVLNVFVQKLGEENAKQITNDTHRGIRMFEWVYAHLFLGIVCLRACHRPGNARPACLLCLSAV